ncbi:single-strand-selective monofunctional uracil-DNA glycosylase 1 [Carcharodon carcharias]|uniref:single-strand-selective monofunctional uracil-DNA glycosylase 1 n=1 Tax=Carcharodon carcharias TaxID=13397 RepID=UPI001B7DA356|nr:single-strand-selective monofunctional uracil-DNA glycosylase 1 [Carcharodon carcharias]
MESRGSPIPVVWGEETPALPEGLAGSFLRAELELNTVLRVMEFPQPVSYVYNPLEYAWEPHRVYVEKYCQSQKEVLLLGMNPGPFGMVQTGVPFGEVKFVRDWLGVSGAVSRPQVEHAKRPVLGLDCPRTEVSGARLWGLVRRLCGGGGPGPFFSRCFVHNLCPLAFLDAAGRNLTPADLPPAPREGLLAPCDQSLRRVVELLGVGMVIGVGRLAERRARRALAGGSTDSVRVEGLAHPSPRNPRANRGWEEAAAARLDELGVTRLLTAAPTSLPTV